MNETTFENAKVSDRVWDAKYGWGTVIGRQDSAPCPLAIWFDSGRYLDFKTNGHGGGQCLRTLFWDEIKFEAPPRPKRMVKKVVEGWVNIIKDFPPEFGPIWSSQDHAMKNRNINKPYLYLGEPLFIHHEYEVEDGAEADMEETGGEG